MTPYFTDDQLEYKDSVVRFARERLNEDLVDRDGQMTFPDESWKRCAEFGILGLPFDESYGGSGADPLTIALALEALGYGCRDNGLLFSLNAQMWSCQMPIQTFGSAEQKERYLGRLCSGEIIGVQAMTEPGSGSDAFSLSTSFIESDDGYILNGTKTFITNAPLADVFVVFATADREAGFSALSAFLVERDTPGLSVGKPLDKMGLRTSPMSELSFDGCAVAPQALLGTKGSGMAIFNSSMEWERAFILMSAVGTMQRQLEEAIAYAQEREQFGQPIGKFQAVSHRIAEMKVSVEAARLLIYQLAWKKSQGRSTKLEAAIAKLFISEAFLKSSLDNLQIHGGYGYMTETGIERDVRDAIGGRIYSGTSEIQKNIIAGHLGL